MSLISPFQMKEEKLAVKTMIEYINAAGGVTPKKLKILQVVNDNDFTLSRVFLKSFERSACINGRRNDPKAPHSTFVFETMQIINANTCDRWALKVLTFSPDVLFMMSTYKYDDLIRELEIYGNLDGLKFIAGKKYKPAFPGVIRAVNEMFKEPDMVFSDGTWIVKI